MLTRFQKNNLKLRTPQWKKSPWQKETVNMVKLYEAHTGNQMKRSGRAYIGKCPFHEDDKPSFAIYEDTNSFYCFGCGESGDSSWFKKKIEEL